MIVAWVQISTGASHIISSGGGSNKINSGGIVDIVGDNTLTMDNNNSGSLNSVSRISVLFSSTSIDKEFQMELLKAVFASLRDLDSNGQTLFVPDFIELSSSISPAKAAQRVWDNSSLSVVSVLSESDLSQFASEYDGIISSSSKIIPNLQIFTPRMVDVTNFPSSVTVLSVQMNKRALSLAVLNRVEKVGINSLIPVLDYGDESQAQWLSIFEQEGRRMGKSIVLTTPIFIDNPQHLESFRQMLDDQGDIKGAFSKHPSPKFGVLLLASQGSRIALRVAAEKKHVQMGWFSPSILEYEEWAYGGIEQQNQTSEIIRNEKSISDPAKKEERNHTPVFNSHFGLYTVNFVGSSGWDNPSRRRMLRELTKYTGECNFLYDFYIDILFIYLNV